MSSRLASRLRRAPGITDAEFDEVFPPPVREVSSAFWTPVSVAQRAARLLVQGPQTRVLDVGSGVGKFCIVGAAATGAWFTGIEHREHFVCVAREAAVHFGTETTRFVHRALDVEEDDFDAFYFFNPFEENLSPPEDRLDDTVLLSEERFHRDLELARGMLRRARAGTRVVTYHGLGGQMPPGFWLALREEHGSGHLSLWIKVDSAAAWPLRALPSDVPRLVAG